MKLEQQIISLSLAKRLKELGVDRDSYFWWIKPKANREPMHVTPVEGYYLAELREVGLIYTEDVIAAFTVAELGEMLPWKVEYDGRSYFLENTKNGPQFEGGIYHCCYATGDDQEPDMLSSGGPRNSDAEERGEMLAYLIENKLITL